MTLRPLLVFNLLWCSRFMKALMFLTLIFLASPSWARPCQVYGISDSPQKLDCRFKDSSIALRCVNGKYFLNREVVSNAFHMEVEEGSVPLVFKSVGMQLTVVIEPKVDIQAELQRGSRTLFGTCL